jgi:DNA-binding CsgD family transcriptional regulator
MIVAPPGCHVVGDVTGQDWSVQELVQTHRWLLDFLLKQFPDGSINVFDRDFRYLYATGAGHEKLGLMPMALIGHRLDEVFPADIVDRVGPFLDRAFDGETVAFTLSAFGREYGIRAWPLTEPDRTIGAVVAVAQEVPTPPQGADELTPRQREVAALVADGLSNKEIARRLGLSMPTVRNYIEHIMARLGFASRTQIALWAFRRGLYRFEEDGGRRDVS